MNWLQFKLNSQLNRGGVNGLLSKDKRTKNEININANKYGKTKQWNEIK